MYTNDPLYYVTVWTTKRCGFDDDPHTHASCVGCMGFNCSSRVESSTIATPLESAVCRRCFRTVCLKCVTPKHFVVDSGPEAIECTKKSPHKTGLCVDKNCEDTTDDNPVEDEDNEEEAGGNWIQNVMCTVM